MVGLGVKEKTQSPYGQLFYVRVGLSSAPAEDYIKGKESPEKSGGGAAKSVQ